MVLSRFRCSASVLRGSPPSAALGFLQGNLKPKNDVLLVHWQVASLCKCCIFDLSHGRIAII
ncbi:MAG TPA: hypothetical protein DCQ10_00880 [Rhodobacteraceae bacterium]|nr:hypothetical protein [Paracoccaceae bacterium]